MENKREASNYQSAKLLRLKQYLNNRDLICDSHQGDRSSRQEVDKEILALNGTLD